MRDRDSSTADGPPAVVERVRDRLGRTAVLHLAAAVVFALVAWSGAAVTVDQARDDARAVSGFGVPYLLGGVAGMIASLAIATAAALLRRKLTGGGLTASACRPAVRVEVAARVFLVLAATSVVAVGYPLAPTGMDRGFVLGVNAVLAGALALFALFTGDVGRAVRVPPPSAHQSRCATR